MFLSILRKGMLMLGKNPSRQLSVKLKQSEYAALEKLAAKTGASMAHHARGFISQGMSIEKSKDDIDFIRRQIREEIQAELKSPMERIIKLLIKVGMMAVTMCFFNRDMLYHYLKNHGDVDKDAMMEKSKKIAIGYMRAGGEMVDDAFNRYLVGESDS